LRPQQGSHDFDTLGPFAPPHHALHEQGITDPTPIQTEAIPHALAGRDVMGLAQTGSGKTAAFGLPMLDALLKNGRKVEPATARALILAPTRELARQIHDTLQALTAGAHLKMALITGGVGFTPQIERMAKGVSILVATPGRLIDLLDRRAVNLSRTEFLVLDEADQMLDLGFIHSLRKIATLLPRERQTMLFSATMPKQMEEIAGAFLRDPVRVQVNPPGKAVDKIEQSVHFVAKAAKFDLLVELSTPTATSSPSSSAAPSTAWRSSPSSSSTRASPWPRSTATRARASATAPSRPSARARCGCWWRPTWPRAGLDIPEVRHIYNYELPNVPENYVHRIGRTARAGRTGLPSPSARPTRWASSRTSRRP
jgi:ATP-dependent RNA helicase RhlE